MSSRKRSTRRLSNRNLRRSIHPMMEDLEQRLVLSSQPVAAALKDFPDYIIREVAVPGQAGKYMPLQAPTPTLSGGYTPQQIQGAYGINQVSFGGITGDGSGQTIALIDAGDNTGFQPTGPNYAGSALQVFDQTFGIPDPPSFQKFNQNGGTALPPQSPALGRKLPLISNGPMPWRPRRISCWLKRPAPRASTCCRPRRPRLLSLERRSSP